MALGVVSPQDVLRALATQHGLPYGWAKVRAGITTVEELLRVTREDT